MPVQADPMKVRGVMTELGIMPNELGSLQGLPLAEGQRRLDEIKERVHKNYKRLAFELHPDRTGNDPAKTEHFKLVGAVKDDFDKLKLEPRQVNMQPPPPPLNMQRVRVVRVVSWASARTGGPVTTGTTSGTTVQINIPFRVATMRPT
jgi:hypothetical protein